MKVIDFVEAHGVPEQKKEAQGGLLGLTVEAALDETAATQAAHGFTAQQETRLAEAFLSRIHLYVRLMDRNMRFSSIPDRIIRQLSSSTETPPDRQPTT